MSNKLRTRVKCMLFTIVNHNRGSHAHLYYSMFARVLFEPNDDQEVTRKISLSSFLPSLGRKYCDKQTTDIGIDVIILALDIRKPVFHTSNMHKNPSIFIVPEVERIFSISVSCLTLKSIFELSYLKCLFFFFTFISYALDSL